MSQYVQQRLHSANVTKNFGAQTQASGAPNPKKGLEDLIFAQNKSDELTTSDLVSKHFSAKNFVVETSTAPRDLSTVLLSKSFNFNIDLSSFVVPNIAKALEPIKFDFKFDPSSFVINSAPLMSTVTLVTAVAKAPPGSDIELDTFQSITVGGHRAGTSCGQESRGRLATFDAIIDAQHFE